MSAATKPKTARQARAEAGVMDVRIVDMALPAPAGHNGDAGGSPPEPPARPRKPFGWGSPPHAWVKILLWGALLLLSALCGSVLGGVGIELERRLGGVR